MIISSLFDIILGIIILLLTYYNFNNSSIFLIKLLNKIDFIHYIVWPTLLFLYVNNIFNEGKTSDKLKKIIVFLDLLFIIIEFFLPIDILNTGGNVGVVGWGSYFVYIIAIAYLLLSFVLTLLE